MNKDLQMLYSVKKSGDICANECARINEALSITKIGDIPEDQLENVKEYLIASLSMNSVDSKIIMDLEKLLELL